MSEQTTPAQRAASSSDLPVAPLLAVAAAALVTAYALVRVSAGSASAWLGALLGLAVALAGGLVLGRWWPGRANSSERVAPSRDTVPVAQKTRPAAHVDVVSALHDEEHVVGRTADTPRPAQHAASTDVDESPPRRADDVRDSAVDTVSEATEPVGDDEPTDGAAAQAAGHTIVSPYDLVNDDHPTVAMHIPAATPIAIDDKPEADALAAKDEVIRSLENIVNENRDKWSDFEAERERLQARIQSLEAELRVASDLIEGGLEDASPDALVAPQVLSRL